MQNPVRQSCIQALSKGASLIVRGISHDKAAVCGFRPLACEFPEIEIQRVCRVSQKFFRSVLYLRKPQVTCSPGIVAAHILVHIDGVAVIPSGFLISLLHTHGNPENRRHTIVDRNPGLPLIILLQYRPASQTADQKNCRAAEILPAPAGSSFHGKYTENSYHHNQTVIAQHHSHRQRQYHQDRPAYLLPTHIAQELPERCHAQSKGGYVIVDIDIVNNKRKTARHEKQIGSSCLPFFRQKAGNPVSRIHAEHRAQHIDNLKSLIIFCSEDAEHDRFPGRKPQLKRIIVQILSIFQTPVVAFQKSLGAGVGHILIRNRSAFGPPDPQNPRRQNPEQHHRQKQSEVSFRLLFPSRQKTSEPQRQNRQNHRAQQRNQEKIYLIVRNLRIIACRKKSCKNQACHAQQRKNDDAKHMYHAGCHAFQPLYLKFFSHCAFLLLFHSRTSHVIISSSPAAAAGSRSAK